MRRTTSSRRRTWNHHVAGGLCVVRGPTKFANRILCCLGVADKALGKRAGGLWAPLTQFEAGVGFSGVEQSNSLADSALVRDCLAICFTEDQRGTKGAKDFCSTTAHARASLCLCKPPKDAATGTLTLAE